MSCYHTNDCARCRHEMEDLDKEIETLRSELDRCKDSAAHRKNEMDEWKRRAYTIWNRMPSFVEIPKEQQQWFKDE